MRFRELKLKNIEAEAPILAERNAEICDLKRVIEGSGGDAGKIMRQSGRNKSEIMPGRFSRFLRCEGNSR